MVCAPSGTFVVNKATRRCPEPIGFGLAAIFPVIRSLTLVLFTAKPRSSCDSQLLPYICRRRVEAIQVPITKKKF